MKNVQSVIKNDLPLAFSGRGEVKGFRFRQIAKSNNGYLYEVSITDGSVHYEVFRRMMNSRFDCISYPSSKRFGIIAWTYQRIEEAMRKFECLSSTMES